MTSGCGQHCAAFGVRLEARQSEKRQPQSNGSWPWRRCSTAAFIGKWVPLSDTRPSSIIDGNKKWLGPMWSQVDENLILRYTASKTQFTTGAKGTVDFRECPMVLEEMGKILEGARRGPLVVNPKTRLPYTQRRFAQIWRNVAHKAGIASTVWNRDLRAAAVTEARQGAAPSDDVAKVAANSKRMVAKVYDRD